MSDPADALALDGNAVAGLLAQAFGRDMTTVLRRVRLVRRDPQRRQHRAYRGAGWVLRCPAAATSPASSPSAIGRDRPLQRNVGRRASLTGACRSSDVRSADDRR